MPPKSARDPAPPDPGTALDLLRNHSLTMIVQQELERQIVGGKLAAGTKLNEADIAAELRVSRGPVREAFRGLDQTGRVRTEKNRGVFVRVVSLEEAHEIYEVRAALDQLIGRLATRRIKPAQLQRLRQIVKSMHVAAKALDSAAYYPLNIEFHEILAEASGNRALIENYRRIVNELNLYRRQVLARDSKSIPISARDHEAIVNAVADGDADLAGRLLFDHVIDGRDRLARTLHADPTQGKS